MKKYLLICFVASIFVACNSKNDLETKKDVVLTDTSKMYTSNGSTDTGSVVKPTPPLAATRIITRTRTVYIDRTPKANPYKTVAQTAPVQPAVPEPQTTANTGANNTSAGTGTTTQTGSGNTGANSSTTGTGNTTTSAGTTTTSKTVQKKEGWSNAAKDATIGGVGGAFGGAIISRNKVKGAIIGGILGAAGGYIIGKNKDKSNSNTTN